MNPSEDDKILIVAQYKHACIYNLQKGTSEGINGPRLERGFSQLVKINSKMYVIGGDLHTESVEEYDMSTNSFRKIPTRLLIGRSRFGVALTTKENIRKLTGLNDCR